MSWRQAAPLAAFLLLMAAACVFVELADLLRFTRPIAFALLLVTPWVWWMHVAGGSGLTGGRGAVALLTRLALIGVLVVLLAEPRAVRKSDVLSVIYVLDRSDSIGRDASDEALSYITRTVSEKPEKDEAGLVVFGRNAAVELPPRMSFPFEAINSQVSSDATNLEKGLALAGAMLPEENLGRIVLITDATQTEGDLTRVLDDLKARDVPVDVMPIEYEFDREVWLERLELPRFVKLGETYEASVVLSSMQAGAGELVLRENGREIFREGVEFAEGKNRFVLPIYLREPGYYEYAATIETPRGEDGYEQNNTAISYLFLRGEGRVLLVTDPQGRPEDWQDLATALRESRRVVEVRGAYDVPSDPLALMPYDAVVFNNVPADAFDAVQLDAVRDAVYNLGVGFLMVGGPNSYGPGGYHRTPIEEALPVTMDVTQKKVLPKGALAIILHTCEFPEGNTWGKNITKQAIKVLGAQDEVGVLVYGPTGVQWLFPLTPASQYDEMVPLINAAQIGDMPDFATTMKLGLDGLKASDAAAKHMIIISDGDPSPPPPELVQQFRDAQISVSTVAIFPHGGMEISMLRVIANETGGRYYYPQDPAQLPSIFIKEAKTLKRSMIQEQTFTPMVEFPSDVLKGINALPPLHGFVLVTPKPRSITVLRAPPKEPEPGQPPPAGDEIDPVLSIWRFGIGKTAAFTSDLGRRWGKDWAQWQHYRPFISQLMLDIARINEEGSLQMRSFAAEDQGVILVEDFAPQDMFLDVQAQVSGPNDLNMTVPLKPVGPRRYEGKFPLAGEGRYQVLVAGVGGDRSERASGGFIVAYSPEYMRFRSNPIMLRRIAERTGGRVLRGDETGQVIFEPKRHPKESTRPVFDWFLIALACLVPLDVAVRRVQLDWSVVRAWIPIGRKAETTQTLGALLQRKERVSEALRSRRAGHPGRPATAPVAGAPVVTPVKLSSTPGSAPAPGGAAPAAPREPAGAAAAAERGGPTPIGAGGRESTTERLLAMKRRRGGDKNE